MTLPAKVFLTAATCLIFTVAGYLDEYDSSKEFWHTMGVVSFLVMFCASFWWIWQ